MATPDLKTVEGLRAYLAAHNKQPDDITLLSGGLSNYAYRATYPSSKTVVYKHAAPYLRFGTSFALDPVRMDYEARALKILRPLLAAELPSSAVHPAELYSYDSEAKLLELSDGGERNLKDAYTDSDLDVVAIGKELGAWIAALHRCSTNTSLSLLDDIDSSATTSSSPSTTLGNNPIGVNIYRYSYQNLHTALSAYGHDPALAKRIDDEYGSKLAIENDCICHGDFWPGNILVQHTPDSPPFSLTVVDWEIVRRGTPATDVAQFAAEAYLLDRFRGARGLRVAFLDAYLASVTNKSSIGRDWIWRMAVHWAVHVAFWPTHVAWADQSGTQELVDVGVEVMRFAVEGDVEGLRKSVLFDGLGREWDDVWERL